MSKLIALRAPAGSGKSTYAKEWQQSGDNRLIISRDIIRHENMGKGFGVDEELVTKIEHFEINAALVSGQDVMVDDCNIQQKYINILAYLAWENGAEFEVAQPFIELSFAEIWWRNNNRDASKVVPRDVVERMYDGSHKRITIPQLPKIEPYVYNPNNILPTYIFDIDGTLAHKGDRGYYEWAKVEVDTIDTNVATIAQLLGRNGNEIVVFSGRDGECYKETCNWLDKHLQVNYTLFMRAIGDQRKDTIVKYELFDNHVRNLYDVKAIFDDRPVVCRLWRKMGIPVFQLGDPHTEF